MTSILLRYYIKFLSTSFQFYGNQIGVTLALLVIGIAIGFLNIFSINVFMSEILNNLFEKFVDYTGITLFIKIFLQNAQATFFIILLGIFISLFPIIATIVNGGMIGYIFYDLENFTPWTRTEAILHLIPHGIFEIPALLLAIAIGISNGLWPFKKEKWNYIKTSYIRSAQCYILIIIPLLLIAGLIEAYNIELARK